MSTEMERKRVVCETQVEKVSPGVNMSDSSDDEPLIKIVKNTVKVAKERKFVPPNSSVDKKIEESTSGDSSDDTPLSELAKKAHSEPQRKLHITPSETATPAMRSRKERRAKMHTVKYDETSSESSDDKPLAEIKQKMTKTGNAQRIAAKRQTTKPKKESLKGVNMSGSSDDEPLIKIAKNTVKVTKERKFVPPNSSVDEKIEESTSGDSSDDTPLSELAKKAHSEPQRKLHITPSETATPPMRSRKERRAKINTVKYDETSSESSDDKPLAEIKQKMTKKSKSQRIAAEKRQTTKLKKESLKTKKPVTEINSSSTSTGTTHRKAGVNMSGSSDDEPLIKIAKNTVKVAKELKFVPPKKIEESTSGDSSDDTPLSELAKKAHSEPQRKLHITSSETATPAMRSRKERRAKINTVKYDETSSESSDDKPLAEIKQKMTKKSKSQRIAAKRQTTKPKEESLKESTSGESSDDEPLSELAKKVTSEPQRKLIMPSQTAASAVRSRKAKYEKTYSNSSDDKPLTKKKLKMTKTSGLDEDVPLKSRTAQKKRSDGRKTTLHISTPRAKQGPDCGSSVDEPSIDSFKNPTGVGINVAKINKTQKSGSSGKRSSNGPSNKAVYHPQVTKMVKIILERCSWVCNENKDCTD